MTSARYVQPGRPHASHDRERLAAPTCSLAGADLPRGVEVPDRPFDEMRPIESYAQSFVDQWAERRILTTLARLVRHAREARRA